MRSGAAFAGRRPGTSHVPPIHLSCTSDVPAFPVMRSPADEAGGGGDKQAVPGVAERVVDRGAGQGGHSADPAGFLHEIACKGAAWPAGTDGDTVDAGALSPERAGWMRHIR